MVLVPGSVPVVFLIIGERAVRVAEGDLMDIVSNGYVPYMPNALPGQMPPLRPKREPLTPVTNDNMIYGTLQRLFRRALYDNIAHYHQNTVRDLAVAVRNPLPTSIPGRPSSGASCALIQDRPIR